MLRRSISIGTAALCVAALGIVNAPAANAYAYWQNGYFYGDTSYRGNVPGSYVKLVGRRDVRRQIYYLTVHLYDQNPYDGNQAAFRVRGWDKNTRQWMFYRGYYMLYGSYDSVTLSVPTGAIDTIIVQDGIYGKTYGTNSIAIFRR